MIVPKFIRRFLFWKANMEWEFSFPSLIRYPHLLDVDKDTRDLLMSRKEDIWLSKRPKKEDYFL